NRAVPQLADGLGPMVEGALERLVADQHHLAPAAVAAEPIAEVEVEGLHALLPARGEAIAVRWVGDDEAGAGDGRLHYLGDVELLERDRIGELGARDISLSRLQHLRIAVRTEDGEWRRALQLPSLVAELLENLRGFLPERGPALDGEAAKQARRAVCG